MSVVRGVESEIDALQRHERAQQQAAADEQDQRERELGDDERAARAAAAVAHLAAAALLQRAREAIARGVRRRHDAEDEAGDERQERGERQHPRVDADLVDPRRPVRRQALQRGDAPRAEDRAQARRR